MPHRIMTTNVGSSPLKLQLLATPQGEMIYQGLIERIGSSGVWITLKTPTQKWQETLPIAGHREAVTLPLEKLLDHYTINNLKETDSVGHRVACDGESFKDSVLVTDETLAETERLAKPAPLHNLVNALGIAVSHQPSPKAPAVAVFDTAFHQMLDEPSFIHPLPWRYYAELDIRHYGLHGIGHKYVSSQLVEKLSIPLSTLRVARCHLGNDNSIYAIRGGQSADMSMSFTLQPGMVMDTRSSGINPSILPWTALRESKTPRQLNQLLNNESGLPGASGVSPGYRDAEYAADTGSHQAVLVLTLFAEHICAATGSYIMQMGGLDALVSIGGVGGNSTRARAVAYCNPNFLGLVVDEEENQRSAAFTQTENAMVEVVVTNISEGLMTVWDIMHLATSETATLSIPA